MRKRESIIKRIANKPLFVTGISLPIIIGGSTNLRDSLVLSVAALYLTFFVTMFLKPFAQRLSTNKRRVLSAIVAAICYIPFAFFMQMRLVHMFESVGIFLPALCVSMIIVYDPKEKEEFIDFSKELHYNMSGTFSFCIAMCVIGAIRELLGEGTLLGQPIFDNIIVPDAAYPYVGFLLFGLLCAVAQTIRNHVRREDSEDE